MGLGVTTEPEAVFFLSQYLGSHELDEDLTEEDRAWDPDLVQYQVLSEMPEEKVIARLRGAYIDMQVTDQWVGLLYLLLPEKKEVVRIPRAPGEFGLHLLSYERWGLLSFISDTESESYTVHTIEEKK